LFDLTRSELNAGQSAEAISYGYDATGNLQWKSDFSTSAINAYTLGGGSCGGGPNAVTAVQLKGGGTRTYCYDAAGNQTSDNASFSALYDHQNLPVKLQRSTLVTQFAYGADGQKARQWGSDGTRIYAPGYEDVLLSAETQAYVGDYLVIRTGSTGRKLEYLLGDRLGSVDAVTDAAGTLTETRGYDAFGAPRTGTWADTSPVKLASTATTPHGFTGHEHLNSLQLIHMNGRVYDYLLGRFLEVDPVIQSPTNSQSLNPYSYLMNNPLSGTDPTGYVGLDIGEEVGCTGPQWVCAQMSNSDAQRSGSSGVGLASVLSHLGINSSATTFQLNNGRDQQKTGTVSVGKLAASERDNSDKTEDNDASGRTSLLNYSAPIGSDGNVIPLTGKQHTEMVAEYKELLPGLESVVGHSQKDVADKFAALALPFTKKWGFEIGANILPTGGRGKYGLDDVSLGYYGGVNIEDNSSAVADVHTHPQGGPGFSGAVGIRNGVGYSSYDMETSFKRDVDSYVYRVGGGAWHFDEKAFRKEYQAATRTGSDIDSRWSRYVEKIQ
jgi:RHS repeat-associated protein